MSDALIVYDGYGDSGAFQELERELYSLGLSYRVIPHLSEYDKWRSTVDPSKPVLFYRNEFMRISQAREVLEFHRENPSFPSTTDTSWGFYQNLTINPSQFEMLEGFKLETKNLWSYIYGAECRFLDIARPEYEQVPIFVLAHNRPEYLTLTLNSLLYSTADQTNRKIVVVLNEATPEVTKVALSYLAHDRTMEFLSISPNAKFASLNVALQVYNPRKFIYCEDDVIFPETTRNYFPQWITQFASRLCDFDIVAWHYGIENVNVVYGLQRLHLPDHSRWLNVSEHEGLTIGGQCFCTTLDYYKSKATESNNWTPVDKDFFIGKAYSPALRLYHLGFNHRIDYPHHTINSDTFKVSSEQYVATKLLTGETYQVSIRDLIQ
jgi:hypothetical protein